MKLYLPTYAHVVLFEAEIKGQLSDGLWENASPDNHWIVWNDCDPVVSATYFGRNFYARKTGYDLAKLANYSIIDRMIFYVKLAIIAPTTTYEFIKGGETLPESIEETAALPLFEGYVSDLEGFEVTKQDVVKILREIAKAMKTTA